MGGEENDDFDLSVSAHAAGKNSGGAALDVDPTRAAKVGVNQAAIEAAMAGLVGGIDRPAEPEQQSFLLEEADELFAGPVKHVAEIMGDARRARGRPKGSQNKSSWRDMMLRMGYRHPGENLLAIANADPMTLAAELSQPYRALSGARKGELVEESVTPHDALALILKANAELMPYFESKRPTEIHVEDRKLGVMIVGDMRTDRGADAAIISFTEVEKPE